MATFELSQREVESVLEQLDDVYRRIEDCEDSDTLRGHANALRQAARMCEHLARDYEQAADEADAEEEEGEECPHCGHGLESDTHKNFCFWQ